MEGWSSMRCRLTWKLRATRSHRFYFQLQVSTLPTDGTGYGLLPTPKTMDCAETLNSGKTLEYKNGVFTNVREKDGMRFGPSLNDIAKQGLLPTPMAQSREPTPEQTQARKEKYGGERRAMYLGDFANLGMLPTPNATDHPGKNTGKRNQDSIPKRIRDNGGQTSQLNPLFVEEMMGFPTNWTVLPFLNGETNQ
jgi:hypothetical protein